MNKFTVAWIPKNVLLPTTCKQALNLGGRLIDQNLTKRGAEEVEQCLKINGEFLPGDYVTIEQ